MTKSFAYLFFELRAGCTRLSYRVAFSLIFLSPLLGLIVDVEHEQSPGWIFRSIADAVCVLGVPLLACALGCAGLQSRLSPSMLTGTLSRAGLVFGKFTSILVLLALPALSSQLLSYALQHAHADADVWEYTHPRADALHGTFQLSARAIKDGGTAWLFKDKDHHLDVTLDVSPLNAPRKVRLSYVRGPGNFAYKEGEDSTLLIFVEGKDGFEEVEEIEGESGRVVFSIPVGSTKESDKVHLLFKPGRSDIAAGITLNELSAANRPRSALSSGIWLALAVIVGASMLVAGAMVMNARFSRGTAFVFALTLFVVGVLGSTLGIGVRSKVSQALADRIDEVIINQGNDLEELRGQSLAWYPDFALSHARDQFEDGVAIGLSDSLSYVSYAPLIALLGLCFCWFLLSGRDFDYSEV